MLVPTLEPKHVRRVAARALAEAGLPLGGMAEVYVTSALSLHLGSTVRTSVNGSYELVLENLANEPHVGSTENHEEHVTHELTMNLLKGIAGGDYPKLYRRNGRTVIICLGKRLAEVN